MSEQRQLPDHLREIRAGEISGQLLLDAELNPFAVTLLLESFQSGPWRHGMRKVSFVYRSNHADALPFRVTIEPAEEAAS